MATKRLSRTIIEGGRTSEDKFDRKEDIRRNRREGRAICQAAIADADIGLLDDEIPDVCMPTETRIHNHGGRQGYWGPAQKDKLMPLHRFLEGYVGKAWNKAYSELKKRFDERTMRGYHLLHDHVRGFIYGAGGQDSGPIDPEDVWWRWGSLYVDDRGILRGYKTCASSKSVHLTDAERNRMSDFLGKRMIMRNGGIFCWVEPCNPSKAIKAFIGSNFGLGWSYTERVWIKIKPKDVKECHHFGGETVGSVSISPYHGMSLRERRDAWREDRRQADGGYWTERKVGVVKFRAGRQLTGREMAAWNKFSQLGQDKMINASGWTKTTSICKFCEEKYEHYSRFCDSCNKWQ